MLEQLFSSKTRVKLLRLFLFQEAERNFYVREITRKIGEHINSVRRELQNLKDLGLLIETEEGNADLAAKNPACRGGKRGKSSRKYFKVNTNFVLYPELRGLLFKSQFLLEKFLVRKIQEIGQVRYLILTGFFTENCQAKTDMLVVGKVNRQKMSDLVRQFEGRLGRVVNYTVMTVSEFQCRRELTDRFLFDILEGKKVVLIDKLK